MCKGVLVCKGVSDHCTFNVLGLVPHWSRPIKLPVPRRPLIFSLFQLNSLPDMMPGGSRPQPYWYSLDHLSVVTTVYVRVVPWTVAPHPQWPLRMTAITPVPMTMHNNRYLRPYLHHQTTDTPLHHTKCRSCSPTTHHR